MAFVEQGTERYRQGDEAGAASAYRRAIDSGDPAAAAEAGMKLGVMHRRAGRRADAIGAYRAAMDTGHPDKAPTAAFLLAGVLSDDGRFREAANAYGFVIESGHEMRPNALYCLAELLRYDLRDLGAAARAYQDAIDSGDQDSAPPAMVGLADLFRTNGPDKAIALYGRAAESGHVEAAPMARRALRLMRGEPEGRPSTAPARDIDGCLLVLDGDGEVTGLWFEDPAVGDAYAADPERLKPLLIANNLMTLMRAGYTAAADYETGGHRITFRR